MRRRDFLKGTGAALAYARPAAGQARPVSLALDPRLSGPIQWAASELEAALTESGATVKRRPRPTEAPVDEFCITAEIGSGGAESVGLKPLAGRPGVAVVGGDARGAVYGLLELADRARHGSAIEFRQPVEERPANAMRSVARLFSSDVEDKPWFNDREMWPQYLTMLATQRFNRFNLSLSIGYDFLREVTDAYFLFPYPFLLAVPGYDVRATNLPDAERDRNLETLKFISDQTAMRGLEFQLGLWMHGYQ
ncbi:MAG TPA: hypothetical protein VGF59_37505 [Bryobacteraceae bacterium]|jgi:hypothetical protein